MYVPGQWLLVARCSPRVSVHTISAKRDLMWTEITDCLIKPSANNYCSALIAQAHNQSPVPIESNLLKMQQ